MRDYSNAMPTTPAATATALIASLTPLVGAAAPAVEDAEPEDPDELPAAAAPVAVGRSLERALRYDGGAAVKLKSSEMMLPSPSITGASYVATALM